MIDVIANALQLTAEAILGVSVVVTLAHLVRATRLLDRVIAIEVLAALTVAVSAMITVTTGITATIDIALAVALISFTGTVAFASFVESTRDDV
ncbi:MAG: monovalent cation/H+ antiporter complex subunit F [Dehalococcoidia bacterium]